MRDARCEIPDAGLGTRYSVSGIAYPFVIYILAWELYLHFETKIEVRDELQELGNMENRQRSEC